MEAIDIKAYVPARDFDLSRRFYVELGFTEVWADGRMAFMRAGGASFFLQHFYVKEHADNFMLHMQVEDMEVWWARVVELDLANRYGLRVQPPQDEPWGVRDFCIIDPTGVLLRIGHSLD